MPIGVYVRKPNVNYGMTGLKHSEEAKRKIGLASAGENHPLFGKHLSTETKKKISLARKGKYTGKKHPSWKGGRKKDKWGYILIHKPEHPSNSQNYVREHRLVVEKYLGRYVTLKERVHHINEIIDDNRIENLIVFKSKGYHQAFHRWGYYNPKYVSFDGRNLERCFKAHLNLFLNFTTSSLK